MIEWVEETTREVSSISPQLEDPTMVKGQVTRLKVRDISIAVHISECSTSNKMQFS